MGDVELTEAGPLLAVHPLDLQVCGGGNGAAVSSQSQAILLLLLFIICNGQHCGVAVPTLGQFYQPVVQAPIPIHNVDVP